MPQGAGVGSFNRRPAGAASAALIPRRVVCSPESICCVRLYAMPRFRWNDWNRDHIARHGVVPVEAERVVINGDRRRIGEN